jgi:hypothetical protein
MMFYSSLFSSSLLPCLLSSFLMNLLSFNSMYSCNVLSVDGRMMLRIAAFCQSLRSSDMIVLRWLASDSSFAGSVRNSLLPSHFIYCSISYLILSVGLFLIFSLCSPSSIYAKICSVCAQSVSCHSLLNSSIFSACSVLLVYVFLMLSTFAAAYSSILFLLVRLRLNSVLSC